MKDLLIGVILFGLIFVCAAQLTTCQDTFETLEKEGLKSIVEDIWEGDKGGAKDGSEPTTVH